MILSDQDIRKEMAANRLVVEPHVSRFIRPASVCLRLGDGIMRLVGEGTIDVRDRLSYPTYEAESIQEHGGIHIGPGEFILSHTVECITMPRHLCGFLSNLTGLSRLGISVASSTFVSPGFGEHTACSLTLEITNASGRPVILWSGMRVCHLIVARLTGEAHNGYDSAVGTYSREKAVRPSRYYREFESD